MSFGVQARDASANSADHTLAALQALPEAAGTASPRRDVAVTRKPMTARSELARTPARRRRLAVVVAPVGAVAAFAHGREVNNI
jgi:hypothetical protein